MEEPAWSASPVEFPSLSELRPSEASKALLSFRDPDVEGKKNHGMASVMGELIGSGLWGV